MRFIHLIAVICLLSCAACNDQGTNNENATRGHTPLPAQNPVPSSSLGHTGTDLLMQLTGKYYNLKNALVATKAAAADSAAVQLAVMAGIVERFLRTDSLNGLILVPYADTILSQSRIVAGVKDETCEKQRLAFGPLSSALYSLLQKAELKNAGIYHEYCPMAYNEKGAFWLSDASEIKNPYFGKKMLECGEVTDSL